MTPDGAGFHYDKMKMFNRVLIDVERGEALAYKVKDEGRGCWAFAGDYFSEYENGLVICRQSFSSGAVRFTKNDPKEWAVIRGTKSIPLLLQRENISDCPSCGMDFQFPNQATAASPERICDDCAMSLTPTPHEP